MAAKRTDEGSNHLPLYDHVNVCTNIFKVLVNVFVYKTKNINTKTVKIIGSFFVIIYPVGDVMLGTVDFYNKLCLAAIKIDYIISNNTLPVELNRVFFKKIIPQMTFFRGHVFSEVFGIFAKIWI